MTLDVPPGTFSIDVLCLASGTAQRPQKGFPPPLSKIARCRALGPLLQSHLPPGILWNDLILCLLLLSGPPTSRLTHALSCHLYWGEGCCVFTAFHLLFLCFPVLRFVLSWESWGVRQCQALSTPLINTHGRRQGLRACVSPAAPWMNGTEASLC